MARLPRLVVPNQLHLILQKGNDGKIIFADDDDCHFFLDHLKEASRQFEIAVHAYVLMPNHLHLLATPKNETGLSKMMQWMGRHYVPYFNRKYQRTGTLWQGRYRATVLEAGTYFLRCCLYLESNPVRSKIVANASDFAWSSYQHHIGSKIDPIISDHPLYWALGNTPFQREAAYKEMMQHAISPEEIGSITEANTMSWPLGTEQFKADIAKLTSRRVTPLKRGRPLKLID